ncbi:MAG TPA: putative Ig domain-containing protein, partial [Verrucomicrobiae bacterium]|nr:putative Ig domain-containing protein [Verrucomicrobiae bacterium]
LSNLMIGGSANSRTLFLIPAACETGVSEIIVTVYDAAGDSASTSFNLTVQGIACPGPISVFESDPGSGSAVVDYPIIGGSECSGVSVAYDPPSGSVFLVGGTSVHTTITKDGVSARCDFIVTVIASTENQAPVLHDPGSLEACVGVLSGFNLDAEDPDVGDTLLYSFTSSPEFSGASLDPETGLFTFETPPLFEGGTLQLTFTITDSGGLTDSKTITLVVHPQAVFTEQPGNIMVPAGGMANFSVVMSGTGPFHYRWFRGATLEDAGILIDEHTSDSATDTLTISPVDMDDSGFYWVSVLDACSATGSERARLTVARSSETITFSNPAPIGLPPTRFAGRAVPYPSVINVAELPGRISHLTVELHGLTHTRPDDLDVLLVAPSGQSVILISDAGGARNIRGFDIAIDDSAPLAIPDSGPIVSAGFYKCSNYGRARDLFPVPAPPGPRSGSLGAFNGTNPNGSWKLFIRDDQLRNVGGLTAGWSLAITTD